MPDEKDFKCLDRRNRGLLPVRCEVWHGWIFINLDENADTLQEFIDPIQDLMGEFPWEGVVVKRRIVIEIDCNRSEEQTSELQSLMRISYAVFCLKNKRTQITNQTTIGHHT